MDMLGHAPDLVVVLDDEGDAVGVGRAEHGLIEVAQVVIAGCLIDHTEVLRVDRRLHAVASRVVASKAWLIVRCK